MNSDPPKCSSCKRPMIHYDADRGYSCGRSDCPRNIEARQEQQRYNEQLRLHRQVLPQLLDYPAGLFSVRELLEMASRNGDGFVLQVALERVSAPKEKV